MLKLSEIENEKSVRVRYVTHKISHDLENDELHVIHEYNSKTLVAYYIRVG